MCLSKFREPTILNNQKVTMINKDSLESEFVKHVLKYRPDSITAQLAREVTILRKSILTQNFCESIEVQNVDSSN